MEKTFCDGCSDLIAEKSRSASPLVILSKDETADIDGDYCGECAQVVIEAVSEAFSDEQHPEIEKGGGDDE